MTIPRPPGPSGPVRISNNQALVALVVAFTVAFCSGLCAAWLTAFVSNGHHDKVIATLCFTLSAWIIVATPACCWRVLALLFHLWNAAPGNTGGQYRLNLGADKS